jgi:hypothetical protein
MGQEKKENGVMDETRMERLLRKKIRELVKRIIREDHGDVTIESIRIMREYNAREGADEYIAIARIYDTPFPWQVRFRIVIDLLDNLCVLEAVEEEATD